METTLYITKIVESLSSANSTDDFADLFVALLRQIALGSPVSRETLGAALGWSTERVAAALDQIPGTENDEEENIVGYGLTLRKTSHAFEIDGRRLYTWCALDTLMFPVIIGKEARVLSRCPATGAPVSLNVTPNQVSHIEPAEAVVSLLLPDESSDIRRSFCCHVHFFASAAVADKWMSQHGETAIVVSVEEAFRLGHAIGCKLLGPAGPAPS
ncbi:organomercurial lyase MerB [Pseudomonas azotoformans]|uniref:Alkylmercury lyase n=1 Tax=Pseudomonas azotoformans TaxID=47878 RepID=A0A127HQV2_PSEAZ|nr:organomercurial lyase MerB [Pseudomonas azotoformans]AMN76853.1 alkylmercury lyase [Pseudomonas azotoformans]